MDAEQSATQTGVIYLLSPWMPAYVIVTFLVSLLLHVSITFPLGFSVRSDTVFGALALASFGVVEILSRQFLKRRILVSKALPYSALFVSVPIAVLVMLVRPFE